MGQLLPLAARAGSLLTARGETVAVGESSAGGLICAALLAQPGASAYFLGGGVLYTGRVRHRLFGLSREDVQGVRSATPAYAELLARTAHTHLSATWGVSETGAAGPSGNPYGDAAGHTCIAVAGPVALAKTLETGDSDRVRNMLAFAEAALVLFLEALQSATC